MIICLHQAFPGIAGSYISAVCFIAVPIFFMISGYFHKESMCIVQIKKVFFLLVVSNIFYLLFDALFKFKDGIFSQFINESFNVKTIFEFVILNESPFALHLWYLGALLYVLVIVALWEHKHKIDYLYFLIPILLVVGLVLGKYAGVLFGTSNSILITRNFLFTGMPYFLLGFWLRHRERKSTKIKLAVLMLIFVMTTCIEKTFLQSFSIDVTGDQYISTAFLAVTAFLFFLGFGNTAAKSSVYLAWIGRKHSTMIYIIHPAMITLWGYVIRFISGHVVVVSDIWSIAAPFIIFISSLVFSILFDKLRARIVN